MRNKVRIEKKSAKEIFNGLYQAAQAEFGNDPFEHGKAGIDDILVFAQDNADDTFNHNEDAEGYWDVALGSIQCSAEAYCISEEVQAWCKAHGYII